MPRAHYIVSDTHLGAVPAERERAFVSFLEHAGTNAATLLINGDLFDFWFEWGPVVPARHYRTLAALTEVVEAGVPITLIGGNHDAWGGRFLSDVVGLRLYNGVLRTTLAGHRALIAHGDGLGKGDVKYRMLKTVLRSRVAVWGFRALHPELGVRLAERVSRTGDPEHDARSSESRAAFLEHWAEEQFAADDRLELVVCGHSHVPAMKQIRPGGYYINSGDWVRHRTYVTIADGGAPELHDWAAQSSR